MRHDTEHEPRPRRRLVALLTVIAFILAFSFTVGRGCTRAPGGPQSEGQRTGPDDLRTSAEGPPATPVDTSKAVPSSALADTTTLVEMRNVHYRIDADLPMEIHHLSDEMLAQGRSYIYFDDPSGYAICVRSAEVGMRPEAPITTTCCWTRSAYCRHPQSAAA